MKVCEKCGIGFVQAHLTSDGWRLPVIARPCGRYENKCDEIVCFFCICDGGHDFISYGKSHKWKEVTNED